MTLNTSAQDQHEPEKELQLSYHTVYGEFSGTVVEVVLMLWKESNKGTGWNFQQWWNWQKALCRGRTDLEIPDCPLGPGSDAACILIQPGAMKPAEHLLDALVDAQCLRVGLRPVTPST